MLVSEDSQTKLEAIPFPAALWRVESEDPGDTRLVACNKLSMSMPGALHRHLGKQVWEFIPDTVELPREYNTPLASLRVARTGVPEHFPKLPFTDPNSDLPDAVYDIQITRWDKDTVLFTYSLVELGKQELDALFEVERRLRMLEHLPGHIVVLNNDGEVIDVNRWADAYHPSDFMHKKQWETGLPEGNRIIKARWERFLQGDEKSTVDIPGLPEGTWYRCWYNRLDPWTVLCSVIDVTEQKQYEQELVARNLELARSNEDLSQFAYVASHDLQEPLRTITSYLDIIREELAEELDEELAEYMGFVAEASGRMKELIQGLLRYSRVETRGESMEAIDLNNSLAMTTKMFRSRPAVFKVDKMPTVVGDPSQIRQVFENLIHNSIRYRKPGTTAQIHVKYVGLREGRHEIAVIDDGIGIDPEYHEMIFQIFKRLHTRHEYEGTGIGLALVRRIIDRHEGKVWVDSAPGKGAAFHLTLPACHEIRD